MKINWSSYLQPFYSNNIANRHFTTAFASNLESTIRKTPQFNYYGFASSPTTHLTDLGKRPANLFFKSLFGEDPTTQPGSGLLFAFNKPLSSVRSEIFGKYDSTVISVCALGEKVIPYALQGKKAVASTPVDLTYFLGENTYQISAGEIKAMIESQKVYVSSLIPKYFYTEMKKALHSDGIVTLPANNRSVATLDEIAKSNDPKLYHLGQFLNSVANNPAYFGFVDNGTMLPYDTVKSLTLYQVGAMILKAEDYRSFVGNGYQIMERSIGTDDAILLLSASGIRGFHKTTSVPGNGAHQLDQKIMRHTFKAALQAMGKDAYAVFPAVGMGVWGGDPNIYWRAFLDAVVEAGADLDKIFINPGHQKTPYGPYKGYGGEEFEQILAEYKRVHPSNENLGKIVNLFSQKTDLLLLAINLKRAAPDKTVAIFNASDPDVTLGNHVGEYVNNLCHSPTTEENFAAAGTSGLGFEGITGVLNDTNRIIQAHD